MDSDDMVFIDNVPSMTVIASSRELPRRFFEPETSARHQPNQPQNPPPGTVNGSIYQPMGKSLLPLQQKEDIGESMSETGTKDCEYSAVLGSSPDPETDKVGMNTDERRGHDTLDETQPPPAPVLPYFPIKNLTYSHCCDPSAVPPPPPPPPPPPHPDMPQFMNAPGMVPVHPLPPPPPPPPPGTLPGLMNAPFTPDLGVETPTQFLPVQYSGESVLDISSRVIRIAPFRRNVFVTRHHAHTADYKEYEWLLKYGSTELWYEKPSKAHLRSIRTLEANRWAPDELLPLLNARPVSLETPKVWASVAMTTPTDDDVYECAAGHAIDDGYAGTCHQCTDEKSEALESTPLVYCLVLSTCQASDPFIHGAHFNGRQIYKLVKCGSREAAVAEAFYAAGVNGWNIAFSCVMKLGEDFEEKSGKAKKVEELWMLAEKEEDEKTVRLFY